MADTRVTTTGDTRVTTAGDTRVTTDAVAPTATLVQLERGTRGLARGLFKAMAFLLALTGLR